MAQPKAKPKIWLTRSESMLADMPSRLRALGADICCEPLLSIEALIQPSQLQRMHDQLARLDGVDISIFISANAVDYFEASSDPAMRTALARQQVFGVGRATVAALKRLTINARCPNNIMSSEGLLMLPELASVEGLTVFIFRGVGGRGYLQSELQQRGARVEHVELYCRKAPILAREVVRAAESGEFDVILIGSVESFDNLIAQIPNLSCDQQMVVPSARVQAVVANAGFKRCAVAASASNDDMAAAIMQQFKSSNPLLASTGQ